PQEPPQEIKVSVHIVARGEKPRKWGPEGASQISVKMPEFAQYKFGDREITKDLKVVAKWINDAKKAAEGGDSKVIGEIKAGHKVQQKFVIAVLNKFAEANIQKVDFYGTAIPGKDLRQKLLLPYPASNYNTAPD
ncbi:MAG: hypothetical protein OER88_01260, partial [Planctomycetota bacterium]|nr:hypothetical protein [Planctomycetota bacterium]